MKSHVSKNKITLPVLIERGEDGYFTASIPTVPGCITQAKTLPDLYTRLQEAVTLFFEVENMKKFIPDKLTSMRGLKRLEFSV